MKKHRKATEAKSAKSEALLDRALAAALGAGEDHLTDVISWHAHVPFAHAMIDLLAPELVVELGVHQGDSLLSMASALQRFGQPGRIVGIDTWRGDDHAGAYDGNAVLEGLMTRAAAFGPRVTLLRSTFDAALPGFADDSIDLLHIDGLHTYDAVRHDFDSWRPKLSSRGVVMFHDIAVRTGDFGVYRFWDEVRGLGPSHGFAFGNGLGVLALGPEVPETVIRLLSLLSTGQGDRLLAAVGEAMEGHSLRRVLALRTESLTRQITEERQRAGAEIARLTGEIEDERSRAARELRRLETEQAAAQHAGKAEIARLSAEAEAAHAKAGDAAALESELQQAREAIASEQARLEAEIAAERRAAQAEIDRLTTALDDAHSTAAAEIDRLTADLQHARQLVQSEQARLEGELAEERRIAGAEIARLAAAVDVQTARAAREYDVATGLRGDLDRLAAALEAERAGSQDRIAVLKRRLQEGGRDLGLARAALGRATARIGVLETELHEVQTRLGDLTEGLSRDLAETSGARDALAQEAAQLHALIAQEREGAGAELARLNALVDADRSAGKAEIDRLNRELANLHRDYTARLEAARLKRRAMRAAKRIAFPVWRMLPLPSRTKSRLRLAIVNRWGHALHLVPPKTPALVTQTQLALRAQSTRYLSLARSATGTPDGLAPRTVSIVIPVYNQIEYTLRCIDAIKANSGGIEHEIIVVDDGSADMTQIMLSARNDIIYLRNARNLGFIGSCNAGLARAGKHYVCFLNNDTEVAPGWLEALVDTFEMHPGVGLAGSQLIYPDGRLQEAGGIIWDDFSGWNWGRLQDPESPRFTYARQADYISGAAVLLPRALALAIGGFDPEFTPAYGEDSDMCFRLRALGLSTLYQPLSRVVHYEGITSGTDTTKGVKAYQVVNAEKLKHRWAHVLPHQGPNGVNPDRAVERGRLGRILVLDQITPEPEKDAGSITALELMLAMRDLGYKVSFVPCSNFTYLPEYTDLLGALGIESVLYPWAKSVEDHLRQVGDIYDAVVIFRVNTATEHLETVRKLAPRAKVVFHNSDLHFLREERARAVANPDIAEHRLSPETTKRTELAIIAKADVTIVHSHFEAELLAEAVPETPVVVFPWVYEPRGPGRSFADRSDIVFLGGYRHYPNVDAVLHYAQDVAPLLEPQLPGARFRAIGSNPTPEMQALASSRLVIEGFVEDLVPVLGSARLMLVPLRYGAGLKGKIVTAMAHGLPVVTTSVGAEGMGLVDGEHVLIADTAQAMADAVARLYSDQALWTRLAQNGLRFVAETTSRAAGLRITHAILSHCDLPVLPQSASPATTPQFQTPAGTPASLFDRQALAAAARNALGEPPGAAVTLVLPGPVDRLQGAEGSGVTTATLGDKAAPSGRWALLLDGCDDAAADAALAALHGARPDLVIFLPPRMHSTARGMVLTHALSGRAVNEAEARAPAHLRHAARMTAAFGKAPVWQADAHILGFPALPLALIAKG